MILDFGGTVYGIIRVLLLLIDSVGLTFIDNAYNLMISTITAFDGESIAKIASDLTKNCYIIIGIFALFKMAFVLINTIITPDKLSDKETNPGNLIAKLVITVSLFVVVPFIFDKSRDLQAKVIDNNYISKLIVGIDISGANTTTNNVGAYIKDIAVRSLIKPDTQLATKNADGTYTPNGDCTSTECQTAIEAWNSDASYLNLSKYIDEYVEINEENVYVYSYTPFVTLVVGLFITYVLFSFAIDIAMRTVELAVLEIISPLFIVTYIDPKSSVNGAFKKWSTACFKTYLSLFIKIAVISLMILFIAKFKEIFNLATSSDGLLQLIILIAILMFCKKAPKWLGELLGTEGGIGQLGIGKKLKEGLPMGDKAAKYGRAGAGMALGATKGLARANKDRRKQKKDDYDKNGIGFSKTARANRHNAIQDRLDDDLKGKRYSQMDKDQKRRYREASIDHMKNEKQNRKDNGHTLGNEAMKGFAAAFGGAAAGAQAGLKADKLSGALTGSFKAANQYADSKNLAKHNTLSDRIRNSKVGRKVAGIPGTLDNAFGDKYTIADNAEKEAKNKKALEFTNHQATGYGINEGQVPVSTGDFMKLFDKFKNQMSSADDIGLATYAANKGYDKFEKVGNDIVFSGPNGTRTISKTEFENGKVFDLIDPNSSFSAEAKKAYATFQEQSLNNYAQNSQELSRETATYREATQQRDAAAQEVQQLQQKLQSSPNSNVIASNLQAIYPGITIDASSVSSINAAFGEKNVEAMQEYNKINAELNAEKARDVSNMSDSEKQEHINKISKLQKDLNSIKENTFANGVSISEDKFDDIATLYDQLVTRKNDETMFIEKQSYAQELTAEIEDSRKYIENLRNANSELQIIVDNIKTIDGSNTMASKAQAVAKAKSDADKELAAYETKKKDN